MIASELVACLERGVGERYRLLRELGKGGMAVVFLAEDLKYGRQVALKVLRPEIASALGGERFLREIRIAARLQHQHILGLYDSGEVDGLLYYTMPYVEGLTLRDRLVRERQLSLPQALRITGQVADALGYAHRHNIVHRDIKPANILLAGSDAVVADFGIAHAVAEAGTEELTKSGMAIGTPAYMSPEQAGGDTHVDGRADIYALGCVLYEMLAGEPPFSGRTPQAVLARHLHDTPPPVRVVRPTTPPAVQEVLERALAKVPADRYATAEEFGAALEAAARAGPPAAPRHAFARRPGVAVALTIGAALLALALWRTATHPRIRLDPNRVVVFPLRDHAPDGEGEGVATYVGYALEGAAPVRWLEGWDWLSAVQRSARGTLPGSVAVAISRRQRARYYIDGAIIRGPDSVTVVLRLHDVMGDSVVKTAGASAAGAGLAVPRLGLEAVGELLPMLLEPGRQIDLSALAQRRPAAIAAFLQGEREYRRMRFDQALEHYRRAVGEDSVFALAALRGAQAANWRELNDEANQLVGIAIASEHGLPPRYVSYARGLQDYLGGNGDSAVADFRQALELAPSWSDAWMALGETYYHLLPNAPSPDALAEAAFLAAQRSDSGFTPPLFHLAEIALRRGDVTGAGALIRTLEGAELDSTLGARLDFMLQCVRDGPAKMDWPNAVRRSPAMVVSASKLLSVGASQAACAQAGFEAVLGSDSAPTEQRWGALLGLQGLLTAQGRTGEVSRLLDSDAGERLYGKILYLVVAAAEAGLDQRATAVARGLGTEYTKMGGPTLWALGIWAARRRSASEVEAIATALKAKADSSKARVDVLLANVMSAHAVLASGDTAGALARFAALRPNAPLTDLEWQLWESLPGERLVLAELLFARGELARADEVAAELQAPGPIVYLTFLPAALRLRINIAVAGGESRQAARLRQRLAALGAGRSSFPQSPSS
jgi:serine/threonine-protein kinase